MGNGVLRSLSASLLAVLVLAMPAPAIARDNAMLVIGHRGASGERPEHTLAAYERAIDQGADYIEPDLVATKDGILVARHENEISGTTDVAERPEFAARKTTRVIDGAERTGWFAEDFTLAELRTLRAKERLPHLRPANARFDGLYPVPTLAEIVKLIRAKEAETGRRIGLYPELKHAHFLLRSEGIDTVELLLLELHRLGVTADDPVFIQSFEIAPLRRLDKRSDFKLVQLVAASGGPADEPDMRYAEMIAPSGLAAIAEYADALGADIRLVLNTDGSATALVADAKASGLEVHAWTLRKENAFLPPPLRSDGDDGDTGNLAGLWALLGRAGVDGVFTDDPALAIAARNAVR